MKTWKLIALVIAVAACGTAQMRAQATAWRIANGPAAGVVLTGSGNSIFDLTWFAQGFISPAVHERCDCIHYHGDLFGRPDPNPNGCGWGCAYPVYNAAAPALSALRGYIDDIGEFVSPGLANKLDDILGTMEAAAADGCYTVVEALANAFADELRAEFIDEDFPMGFDNTIRALTAYVTLVENTMFLPFTRMPVIRPNTVMLLRRSGSGDNSRVFDAGPRIRVRRGQMASLEAYAMTENVLGYRWNFKWKGSAQGEERPGTAVSFRDQRLQAIAFYPTLLQITVYAMLQNGSFYRDKINVQFE